MFVFLSAQLVFFGTLLPLEECFVRRLQRAIKLNIRSMDKKLCSMRTSRFQCLYRSHGSAMNLASHHCSFPRLPRILSTFLFKMHISAWPAPRWTYFKVVSVHIAKIRPSPTLPSPSPCSVPSATLLSSSLPPPSQGLKPHHIAIRQGTKNYTCNPSDPSAAPFDIGASSNPPQWVVLRSHELMDALPTPTTKEVANGNRIEWSQGKME